MDLDVRSHNISKSILNYFKEIIFKLLVTEIYLLKYKCDKRTDTPYFKMR